MNLEEWILLPPEKKNQLLRLAEQVGSEGAGLDRVFLQLRQQLMKALADNQSVLSVDLGKNPETGQIALSVNYDSESQGFSLASIPSDYHGIPVFPLNLGDERRRYKKIWKGVTSTVFKWTEEEFTERILLPAERASRLRFFYYQSPMYAISEILARVHAPNLRGLRKVGLKKEIEKILCSQYKADISDSDAKCLSEEIYSIIQKYN
jgi:hypothetical protein